MTASPQVRTLHLRRLPLGIGGVLALIYGGLWAGPIYDVLLHSIFLGFVFSMIFGHAPIIFPAVLGIPIRYSDRFYSHLVLLHVTLAVRVAGDLLLWMPVRQWVGLSPRVSSTPKQQSASFSALASSTGAIPRTDLASMIP